MLFMHGSLQRPHVMDRLKLRWLVLGLAFGLALLLGRWGLFPREVERAPAHRADIAASAEQAPALSAAIPEVIPDVAVAQQRAVRGGTFRGRVIDAVTRQAVQEFRVQLQPFDPARSKEVQARTFRSSTGRFAWNNAPAGSWRVTVAARGYQGFQLHELNVADGKITGEIVLPLLRGYLLQGRVFDESSKVGIGSARVYFQDSDLQYGKDWLSRGHVVTKQDGSFVLEGIPAGRITLQVAHQDYALSELEVLIGTETPTVEVGLSAGGKIAGYLAAADSTPVAGTVMLDYRGPFRAFSIQAPTSDAGEFSFDRLPAGQYRVASAGAGAAASRDIVLGHGELVDGIVLAAGKMSVVRGVVRGLQAEEIRQSSVQLLADRGSFNSAFNDLGAYSMHGVPAGEAQLMVLSPRRSLMKTIEVPSGADLTVDVDFPPGARLSGRVTRDGKAVDGVRVSVQRIVDRAQISHVATTAQDGRYRIDGVAPGGYIVEVSGDVPHSIEMSSDTVFDIAMTSALLAGRVLEEGGNVPVVGAAVHVVQSPGPGMGGRARQLSDHFGAFSVSGIETGDVLLSVYKEGYEMFRERISYSSPITNRIIRLARSKGVEIRVRATAKGELPRALRITEAAGNVAAVSFFSLRLDSNGVGFLPSALAGSTLSISALEHGSVVVRAWDGQPLELDFNKDLNKDLN